MTEPLKVMHVIPSLECGGAENQALRLLNGLDSGDFERHLVTFRGTDTANKRALDSQVRHHILPIRKKGQAGWIFRMALLLRRVRPDIVHAHMFDASLYGALAIGISGVGTLVTTEHGQGNWKRPIHHRAERVISRVAASRVAVSADIAREMVAAGDVPGRKMRVIENGVPVGSFKARQPRAAPLRMITVGRLETPKDYPTMLQALRILADREVDFFFHFVGDGTEAPSLKGRAAQLGLNGRAVFEGYRADAAQLMETFDIFALSSVSEGLPVAMLEAMSAGLPVVATKVGGIPDTVREGVEGLLVPPSDPQRLADALETLCRNAPLRMKLGGSARKTVESRYSMEAVCGKYASLYRSLATARAMLPDHGVLGRFGFGREK